MKKQQFSSVTPLLLASPEKLQQWHDLLMNETGIDMKKIYRNVSPAVLYEKALKYEEGSAISNTGALITSSLPKTGRSPKDKRIVQDEVSDKDVWWGPINIPMDEHTFMINRERAVDYLNIMPRLYIFDGFAGWDPKHRIKVRVICSRAYHCLFMHNMLIRPTSEELETFGSPDFTILNAGDFPANKYTTGMSSDTSIAISFKMKEMVILGTRYAGEMKKGIFTVMHYLMPQQNVLSLHSSANIAIKDANNVSLFFGLSGTGKTTLSTDLHRNLIGDDEICWSDNGIFNVEGGCYAKCYKLSEEKEPEIYAAIKFGSVLENVDFDSATRIVNYNSADITENTRCAYQIEYVEKVKIPCMATHPKNLIFLSCDAFGILPPVSRLTIDQAIYHFISGYTAKVAGTEEGVNEPVATFSACFGEPFLALHPLKYAKMLSERIHRHSVNVWLVNTGWIGGGAQEANRISIEFSRSIVDAIHNGSLLEQPYENFDIFNLQIPKFCPNVPSDILNPINVWSNRNKFIQERQKLANLFNKNFEKYSADVSNEVKRCSPK